MRLLKMLLAIGLLTALTAATACEPTKTTAPETAKTAPAEETKAPAFLHATLVKVDGKNLAVKVAGAKGEAAKEMTVATNVRTKFILDYENGAKLSDLKPGMTLTLLPGTGTAATVKAHVKGLYGTVVKVDGKNLIITATKTKKQVTIVTDDNTKVVINGKAGAKLADLKAGTEVKIVPETGTAAKVSMVIPQPALTMPAAAADKAAAPKQAPRRGSADDDDD